VAKEFLELIKKPNAPKEMPNNMVQFMFDAKSKILSMERELTRMAEFGLGFYELLAGLQMMRDGIVIMWQQKGVLTGLGKSMFGICRIAAGLSKDGFLGKGFEVHEGRLRRHPRTRVRV
jgi:hypothetical protein